MQLASGALANCIMQYVSATSIKMMPHNGLGVKINGIIYPFSSGGVSAANTNIHIDGTAGQNLAASTLYYVYVYVSGGNLVLDFSTTGYATDTAAGNAGTVIKSGDATRSLIGMVYTNGSSQFADSATYRGVRSWFNDFGIAANSGLAANKTTTSATFVKMDSTTDVTFLAWANELIQCGMSGCGSNNGGSNNYVGIGIDGTTPEDAVITHGSDSTAAVPYTLTTPARTMSEGAHTASLLGAVSANTMTLYGAAAPANNTPAIRTSFWVLATGVR
jgi:hypothetical protein